MYSEAQCEARWASVLAPHTGSVATELVDELSQYLGIPRQEVAQRLSRAAECFADEWRRSVANPADEPAVIAFYNESSTELFDLVQWHATDTIHYRTLVCIDIARERGAKTILDYGSGIGSDALAFLAAGCDVTLADVSEPLLAFATWRCRQRGFDVKTIDLKRGPVPATAYDAAVCFDVLEHVTKPVRTLRSIHAATRLNGLLFVHAPFGVDPDRPMHVVHEDVITPRMRVVGFHWRGDLEARFPSWLWAPRVYERLAPSLLDRAGYYLHDVAMPNGVAHQAAKIYRRLIPNRSPSL